AGRKQLVGCRPGLVWRTIVGGRSCPRGKSARGRGRPPVFRPPTDTEDSSHVQVPRRVGRRPRAGDRGPRRRDGPRPGRPPGRPPPRGGGRGAGGRDAPPRGGPARPAPRWGAPAGTGVAVAAGAGIARSTGRSSGARGDRSGGSHEPCRINRPSAGSPLPP